MIQFKHKNLLKENEYEDYDVNVANLTIDDQSNLGLIKTCCGTDVKKCPKVNGAGSCCQSKQGCPKNNR